VNERPCIRCGNSVLLQDGHLVFCTHCGAPQIFLSDQLQVELAEQTRSYTDALKGGPTSADGAAVGKRPGGAQTTGEAAGTHAWTIGVQCALLSAGVALALGLLSLVLPIFSLLLLLWIACAPIATVAYFQSRARSVVPPAYGFAARLGLLTGLLISFCSAILFTLDLLLSRFLLHASGSLDAQLAAAFAQQRATVLARLGAQAQPTLDLFAVPEFRVGLLLSVLLVSAVFYLALSTLGGGLAGLLVRRRRDA
jgi:hypothetical protein